MTDTTMLKMQMDDARTESANIIRSIAKTSKKPASEIAGDLDISTHEVIDAIKFGGPMHERSVYLALRVIENSKKHIIQKVDEKIKQDTSLKEFDYQVITSKMA